MRAIRCVAPSVVAMMGLCGSADAALLYSNNFENAAPGPEWSSNARYDFATPFTQFMGRYQTTDSVTLTLPTPPTDDLTNPGGGPGPFNLYTVKFDLFTIDKWAGNDPLAGLDQFELKINGQILFLESMSNLNTANQSFRMPDFGPQQVAFGGDKDAIYRNIAQDFTIPATQATFQIKFRSSLNGLMSVKSWGIDNVRVSYLTVPTPGTAALLCLGGFIVARRRRA